MRKILVFGGPNLNPPQYTVFPSAIRDPADLHGHPGDEAVIVTAAEVEELRRELYAGMPMDPLARSEEQTARFRSFCDLKLIRDDKVEHYVVNEMATVKDAKGGFDLRSFVGLAPKRGATADKE